MVIYNLDETPDIYITPNYYDDVFRYRMEQFSANDTRTTVRSIDIRTDKLNIHGTEIKESMFKRLYESLVLRPRNGIVAVNCNGCCFSVIEGKVYRTINNGIFDWSGFGVVVPSSTNDSFRKQVEDLRRQVEKSDMECELAKASLKDSCDEVNGLKKAQIEMGLKMQKVYEKVALIDFELELYKIELESCKKESDEVFDEFCTCKDEKLKIEVELKNIRDQLSSEISSFSERNRELDLNSKILEEELSLVRSEIQSAINHRDLLGKTVKELEERLISCENHSRDRKEELEKLQYQLSSRNRELEDELSLVRSELQSTKENRHSLDKNVKELEERLSSCECRNRDIKVELEEVQDQLCMANKEVKELKDQIKSYEKEKQCMEAQLDKMISHIKLINSESKLSNQKLDQVLISKLWKEFNRINHLEFGVASPSIEIIAYEIPIY